MSGGLVDTPLLLRLSSPLLSSPLLSSPRLPPRLPPSPPPPLPLSPPPSPRRLLQRQLRVSHRLCEAHLRHRRRERQLLLVDLEPLQLARRVQEPGAGGRRERRCGGGGGAEVRRGGRAEGRRGGGAEGRRGGGFPVPQYLLISPHISPDLPRSPQISRTSSRGAPRASPPPPLRTRAPPPARAARAACRSSARPAGTPPTPGG